MGGKLMFNDCTGIKGILRVHVVLTLEIIESYSFQRQ